jgi:signal peptidase
MRIIHLILNFLSYIFFFFALIAVVFTVGSNSQLFGNYQSFLVRSGSMEPTIMTGDVIIIKSFPEYNKNDVITYRDAGERIVTHRIIETVAENDKTVFITKGDANRSIDNDTVSPEEIIGKVLLMIPKMGFVISFSQTTPGLITLIIIPTVLIVLDQIIKSSNKSEKGRLKYRTV